MNTARPSAWQGTFVCGQPRRETFDPEREALIALPSNYSDEKPNGRAIAMSLEGAVRTGGRIEVNGRAMPITLIDDTDDAFEAGAWIRATEVAVECIGFDGTTRTVATMASLGKQRAKRITILIEGTDAQGAMQRIAVDSPVGFDAEEDCDTPQDVSVVVGTEPAISKEALTELLVDGWHRPVREYDSDSEETLRERATIEAVGKATGVIQGTRAGRRALLERAIRGTTGHYVNAGDSFGVHIERSAHGLLSVDVTDEKKAR